MHDSTEHCLSIGNQADLKRIAAAVATHAPHQLPLYRAVSMGLINLLQPERAATIPKRMVEKARRVRQWGRRAMVHAAEGKPEHYALAVTGALACGRLVLVECSTAHERAWGAFLAACMPVLDISAPDGLPHPIAPRRGETH